MCGIVGFITKQDKLYSQDKRHFMRHALALDTLRGFHSTGVFTVNSKGVINTKHSLLPGDRWVHGKAFDSLELGVTLAVGHNRAATKGSVTLDNAHPFTFGDVTMVHNGTLIDGGRSLDTYDNNLEVDSQQIALALSMAEPDDAKKVLENLNGSFALVWYDTRDETINFARNTDRPLHITWNSSKTAAWFMSDADHLRCINKSLAADVEGNSIYGLKSLVHNKMRLGEGVSKPERFEFSNYVPPKKDYSDKYRDWNIYPTPSKNKKTALTKWREKVGNSGLKVDVNDKKRTVPEGQSAALKEMYDLSSDTLMEFVPEETIEFKKAKRSIVTGKAIIEDWGFTPWPCVLLNIPLVQSRAYKNQSWVIRPIGLGKTLIQDEHDVPHIMGHLIHCDWKAWENTKRAHEKEMREQEEREEKDIGLLLPGPEGHMIKKSLLNKLIDKGCPQCNEPIAADEVTACVFVNENRDLLCVGCQKEVESGWQEHMASQARIVH